MVEQAAAAQARPAARTTRLTLDEAVSRALENNLDIAVQRLNPQIADLDIASAQAAFLPTFDSTVGSSSRTQPSTTQLDGGQRVVVDTTTYNTGLTQALKWGGATVDASWSNSRNETTSIFSSFNPSYRSNLDLVYTQPLLRGFKIDPIRQRLQVTRLTRELSDIDLRRMITNTDAAVRSAYWDLVIASETIAVQQQFVELAEDLIADNQARVELGTLAPIDIIQSQSEAAQRRQVLTEALQVRRTAELVLKRLLVGGTDDPLWEAENRARGSAQFRSHAGGHRGGRPVGARPTDRHRALAPSTGHQRHQPARRARHDAAGTGRPGVVYDARPRRYRIRPVRTRRRGRQHPSRGLR